MKKIVISIILLCFALSASSQIKSEVDERFELTGVVFRLAGIPEYSDGAIEQYNNEIDNYFHKYRYHKVTEYIVKLRNENRLGYVAVASSALFICIKNGKVVVNPDLSLSQLPGMGSQWSEKSFLQYIKLLDDFYRKSNFQRFFADHKLMYREKEMELNGQFVYFKPDWFLNFFGKQFKTPQVFVAMGNGVSNYYIADYNSDAGYAIVIAGKEQFIVDVTLPPLIHEICHHYSNEVFDRHWEQMRPGADSIYSQVAEKMLKIAYSGARTSMLEWQNNLFVTMYFRENLPLFENFFSAKMRDAGFIWLPRSIAFMDNFYQNRDRYKTIEEFMPQLASFINYTAQDFDRIKFEHDNNHPYIIGTFPSNGSVINKGDLSEIKVRFSEPMFPSSFSISMIKDDSLVVGMPRSGSINPYWMDDRTFVIPIEKTELKSGKKYGLYLGHGRYVTSDFRAMKNDYIITYNINENF